MLKIKIPAFCTSEIEYTCSVVFTEWIGIKYELIYSEQDYLLISFGEKELKINASFFIKASSDWLGQSSMPVLPLKLYNLSELKSILSSDIHIREAQLPVLYGIPKIKFNECCIDCGIDIFGGIFFMISRYEEIVVKGRDNYNRFSGKSSIAYKENFIFRPIVNEYLELLFSMLLYLCPNLTRNKMRFQMIPTHDVDIPFFCFNQSLARFARRIGGDILKRKSFTLAFEDYCTWDSVRKNGLESDPFYTFDFIMSESEKRNLQSAFYFLPSSSPEMNMKYPITLLEMRSLLQKIDNRGHEIGIHGCYGTYLNQKVFASDVCLLNKTMESCGIKQKLRGGRQHILQWQNPDTFRIWDTVGMDYDSTLSFADVAGFRCGTCYEYSVFDISKRKKLSLKERPLIAMECTILAPRYMNMGLTDNALMLFKRLKDACKYYGGNFVLLFHNNEFADEDTRRFYIDVLDC